MWKMHDGRSFGSQELNEKSYTVETDFVKRPGGQHGGEWSARIKFVPKVSFIHDGSIIPVTSRLYPGDLVHI